MTIKEARLDAGLTQKAMADLMGIPKRTIENWDGGKAYPVKWVEQLVIERLMRYKEEGK